MKELKPRPGIFPRSYHLTVKLSTESTSLDSEWGGGCWTRLQSEKKHRLVELTAVLPNPAPWKHHWVSLNTFTTIDGFELLDLSPIKINSMKCRLTLPTCLEENIINTEVSSLRRFLDTSRSIYPDPAQFLAYRKHSNHFFRKFIGQKFILSTRLWLQWSSNLFMGRPVIELQQYIMKYWYI